MTKYNTGNPVGSADPRDLYDNAENTDVWVLSKAKKMAPDRLGFQRKTWYGMESEFAAFIAAGGYVGTGTEGAVENYAAGIEITGYNQIVRDALGEFWRLSGPVALPYTTTGAGLPEGGAFVAVGDAALRQELNGPLSSGQGATRVKGATIYVGSLAELEALPSPTTGQEAMVSGVPFKYDGAAWYPSAGYVTLRAYGAVGSGDETTKIAACVAAAASAKARILDYTGKTYSYSSIISTPYFDYDGNSTFYGSAGGYFYVLGQGFPDEVASVTAAASIGDYTVAVSSTAGLTKGNIIFLENTVDNSFSAHRLYYHDGEINIVESVTPTEITVRNPLQSSYPAAATMKVYGATFGTMRTNGGRFISDAAFALRARICHKVRVNDTYCEAVGASRAASLVIDRCYNAELKGVSTRLDYLGTGAGEYGLSVSNSQDVISWGGNYHAGRHPVTTGGSSDAGAVPCRNVKIIKATMANDPASGIYAADFHGNTVDSFYEGCTIYGSAGLAGEDVACRNSIVYARPGGTPLDMHEVVGGNIDFSGCKVISNGAARIIGFASSALADQIDRDYQVIANKLELVLDSACVNVGTFYVGATVDSRFIMDGLTWSGDFSGLTYVQAFTISAGATKPKTVKLKNIEADISTITGWASGLASSTGTKVTMPVISKTQAIAILAGNSESTSGGTGGVLVFDYPAYPVVPTVEAHSAGNLNTGSGYAFPVISGVATISQASGKMVMGNDATTATNTRSYRMTLKVGLEDMEI